LKLQFIGAMYSEVVKETEFDEQAKQSGKNESNILVPLF